MRKVIFRTNDNNEFCALEVEVKSYGLSICGMAGYLLTRKQARKQAKDFWVSFFEDEPEQIKDMNKRMGTNFRSPNSAAKFVLDTDGEMHGLDIVHEEDDMVYVCHSCGQLREKLAEWFPETVKFYPQHLKQPDEEAFKWVASL